MDGRLVVTHGDLYDVLELGARNLADAEGLPWVKALENARIAFRAPAPAQRPAARADATSRITTIWTRASTISSSTRTGNIPAPISNIPANARGGADSPRSAISPRSSWSRTAQRCSTSAAASAAWRFISPASPARAATGVTLSRGAVRGREGARRRSRASPTGSISASRTIATSTEPLTASSRSACSSMSASAATTNISRTSRRLLKDDGVMLLHSIGRNAVPGATNPWIRRYIFPAAIFRGCRRCCRRSSAPGSMSPISRSCGCTTPRRCGPGASVSWPAATKP